MEAAALPAGVGIAQRPLAEDRGRVITSKAMARFSRRPGFLGIERSASTGADGRLELPGDHRPDRRDHDQHRPEGLRAPGPGHYEKGIKVTDQELAAVNIERDQFHPDWNYTIPTQPKRGH